MDPELKSTLQALLGDSDTVQLNADGTAPEAAIAELKKIHQERKQLEAFLAKVEKPLALSATPTLSVVEGAILKAHEDLKDVAALRAEVDGLKATQAKEEHAALIGKGLADGKLTEAMRPWAEGCDTTALKGYLDAATAQVPTGTAGSPDREDSAALSASAKKLGEQMGLSAEDMEKYRQQ